MIVDEIIDTGLTLSWLDLEPAPGAARPASGSPPCCASPRRCRCRSTSQYVGWDIPNEFVVGYGLDYHERYRNLRDIGTLAPHVYS